VTAETLMAQIRHTPMLANVIIQEDMRTRCRVLS